MQGIDLALEKVAKGKLKRVLKELKKDKEVKGYLEQANKLAVIRLGYNDHGEVHSKIVAFNALRMFDILDKKGIKPNIVSEEVGSKEDSEIAILLGAYLHDIGCSVSREAHEIVGVAIALPIINRILGKFYDSDKLSRISCFVCEAILCHMGFEATSLEAKLVEVADGTDISKGRARIPFHIGKKDIHKFSALAIERVDIREGEKTHKI